MNSFAQTDPVSIFDQVWHSYDTLYSGFVHKYIDWDLLYKIYRPSIKDKTSEDELFEVVTDMLTHLHDNHVQLIMKIQSGIFLQGYMAI
jgi:carboxyl-terminal processing protease